MDTEEINRVLARIRERAAPESEPEKKPDTLEKLLRSEYRRQTFYRVLSEKSPLCRETLRPLRRAQEERLKTLRAQYYLQEGCHVPPYELGSRHTGILTLLRLSWLSAREGAALYEQAAAALPTQRDGYLQGAAALRGEAETVYRLLRKAL